MAAAGKSRVTVAVRIKPTGGAKTPMRVGARGEHTLQFTGGRSAEEPKPFSFDHVFDQSDPQASVFDALGPPVLEQLVPRRAGRVV